MAQSITIWGASYSDVPAILLPKSGGGTAQFDDTTISSDEASASDILSGKKAYVNGQLVTGTGSGGGSGLEYEAGTYTPTSDIARPTISFTKTHSSTPALVVMSDVSSASTSTSNSSVCFIFYDPYRLFGAGFPYSTSSTRYGYAVYSYRSSSSMSTSTSGFQYNSDNSESSGVTYPRYWADESGFHPYANSSSRYWRSGRTYKWMAVWKPST